MSSSLQTNIIGILFADTCDTVWQFSRDGLITSAFVLSAIACVAVVIVVWCVFRKNWEDKYETEVS